MLSTMILAVSNLSLLAQADGSGGGAPGGKGGDGGLFGMLPLLVVMIAIFYFILFRPQSKKANERKEMLANLRKGDKVLTIGGMIGTIVNIKDDELTVKVDESSNTKITFVRSAIDRVIRSSDGGKQETA